MDTVKGQIENPHLISFHPKVLALVLNLIARYAARHLKANSMLKYTLLSLTLKLCILPIYCTYCFTQFSSSQYKQQLFPNTKLTSLSL
jgi:hypothetical protein